MILVSNIMFDAAKKFTRCSQHREAVQQLLLYMYAIFSRSSSQDFSTC